MDQNAKRNQLLLDTEQMSGHPEDADRAVVEGFTLEMHTAIPGIIKSFNITLQTVEARPAVRRLQLGDGRLVELPLLVDVPCFFPGGVLTFPVASGDSCLLAFSERCIDGWYASGNVSDPLELRHHDLSDALAFVGFQAAPQALVDVYAGGPEMRTKGGGTRISIRGGEVHIGTASSISGLTAFTNGVVLASHIDTLTELPLWLLGGTSWNVFAKE